VATSSADFHESPDDLLPETRDRHRAVVSLAEELEAVDWYDQRIDATDDEDLQEVLRHNRDEEKEHAAMALEWLRRRDPTWDRFLRQYLFTDGPIVEIEAAAEAGSDQAGAEAGADAGLGGGSLGLGRLAGKELL
jgi:uncharacterized protein